MAIIIGILIGLLGLVFIIIPLLARWTYNVSYREYIKGIFYK